MQKLFNLWPRRAKSKHHKTERLPPTAGALRRSEGDRPTQEIGQGSWVPTHQHSKGGLYRVMTRGVLEADHTPMVVYDDAQAKVWIRPVAEFDDGRFKKLD